MPDMNNKRARPSYFSHYFPAMLNVTLTRNPTWRYWIKIFFELQQRQKVWMNPDEEARELDRLSAWLLLGRDKQVN